MKIKLNGYTAKIDLEALAKAMAINYADWKAYMGKAKSVAQALPKIMHIEKELF